jgi:hypothetical protein
MHSDWFNGKDILHGRWQHGEKVGSYYPNGLEKTLCKWEVYVPLVTKGLKKKETKPATRVLYESSQFILQSTLITLILITECG